MAIPYQDPFKSFTDQVSGEYGPLAGQARTQEGLINLAMASKRIQMEHEAQKNQMQFNQQLNAVPSKTASALAGIMGASPADQAKLGALEPMSPAVFDTTQKGLASMASKAIGNAGKASGGLSPEVLAQNIEAMKSGAPLSLIAPRGKEKSAIVAAYQKEITDAKSKGIRLMSPNELEANYKAEQTRARTLNSQQMTDNLASITQYNSAADAALQALDQVNPGRFIPLNKITQDYISKVDAGGDKQSAQALAVLKNSLLEMSLQGGKVFTGNALTDTRFKQEAERLNSSQDKDVTKAVIASLRQIANSRGHALTSTPTMVPNGMQQPGAAPAAQPQQNQQAQPVNDPYANLSLDEKMSLLTGRHETAKAEQKAAAKQSGR